MKLRSSRRLTRSSDHRAKARAFTREIVARVSSRLPSSGTRPFVLRSNRRSGRELAHSCINFGLVSCPWNQNHTQLLQDLAFHNLRVQNWDLRLQNYPQVSEIMIHIEVVQETLPFHRAYFESVVSALRVRESMCFHWSCLPPTDDRIKTPISSLRMPPQVWPYHVCVQILRRSAHSGCSRNAWAMVSNTLP